MGAAAAATADASADGVGSVCLGAAATASDTLAALTVCFFPEDFFAGVAAGVAVAAGFFPEDFFLGAAAVFTTVSAVGATVGVSVEDLDLEEVDLEGMFDKYD
jgi:hypothetical protein